MFHYMYRTTDQMLKRVQVKAMCLPPTVLVPTSCALKASAVTVFGQKPLLIIQKYTFAATTSGGREPCIASHDQISMVVAAKLCF